MYCSEERGVIAGAGRKISDAAIGATTSTMPCVSWFGLLIESNIYRIFLWDGVQRIGLETNSAAGPPIRVTCDGHQVQSSGSSS